MTKEERAGKWFRKIANSEAISMEKKMEICNKVAKKMVILFIVIFLLEFVLLFMINDRVIFNHLLDFLNRLSEEKHTRNHYKGIALVGTLLCLPIMVLPIIVTLIFKKTWMKAEVYKVIDKIKRDKTFSPNNEPVSCMNEWMGKWERIKENLDCQIDLDSYFTKKQIGRGILNILDIGTVYFPTGRIFACDPMIELEDAKPYI